METVIQTAQEIRAERAEAVKHADDIPFPTLRYWNYGGCAAHATPKPDCEFQACGGELFSHQRVGIMWLYLRKKGLLGDLPGAGKTSQILGLAALLKERGELTQRMVVVCQTPAVLQWLSEAQRWVPKLRSDAIYSGLTRKHRIQKYIGDWDILIIGYHMMLQDWRILEKLEPGTLIVDDVDPLLNHGTATHDRIVSLSRDVERCVVMNGTPIQVNLEQIHAALLPAGGFEVFGSLSQFQHRFVRQEFTREVTRSGKVYTKKKTTGYRNGMELKRKLSPMYLRRTYEDLTDIRIPTLMPPKYVWLELHPAQRARYTELQKGILRLKRDDKELTKHLTHAEAFAKMTYAQQITSGLPALNEPDGKEASVKLDWLLQQVTTTWADRKVVAFIKNLGMVRAAEARLAAAGVGSAKIWGPDAKATHRSAEINRFWQDPQCRVLLGTSAIERSLNLQNANILVNVDTIMNPARMSQLAGRIRRAGSKHSHIFVFSLFCHDTHEERMLPVLKKRQAMADFVWEEQSELYESLSPLEMLSLITP